MTVMFPRIAFSLKSLIFFPSIKMVPDWMSYNLFNKLNMVVFPDPLFPTIP